MPAWSTAAASSLSDPISLISAARYRTFEIGDERGIGHPARTDGEAEALDSTIPPILRLPSRSMNLRDSGLINQSPDVRRSYSASRDDGQAFGGLQNHFPDGRSSGERAFHRARRKDVVKTEADGNSDRPDRVPYQVDCA